MPAQDLNPALTIQRVEGGFPHSEILGSKLVRSSPRHIAAYHVLHRLSAPRHPPDALTTLDYSHDQCPHALGKRADMIIKERPALGFLPRHLFACQTYPAHAAAGRGWFARTRTPDLPNMLPLYDFKHPRASEEDANLMTRSTAMTRSCSMDTGYKYDQRKLVEPVGIEPTT